MNFKTFFFVAACFMALSWELMDCCTVREILLMLLAQCVVV